MARDIHTSVEIPAAADLRTRFKAIPEDIRQARQSFSVRIWRGLSWLERSELDTLDVEGRFISLWIAFNAVYGQLQEDGWNAPDHATWQRFLAEIVRLDGLDKLGNLLYDVQVPVLRLIENKYIYRDFWLCQSNIADELAARRKQAIGNFNRRQWVPILQELFERLYILRQQVMHGAATVNSSLNRACMKSSTGILSLLVPVIIEIMLQAGPDVDWGQICFPPQE